MYTITLCLTPLLHDNMKHREPHGSVEIYFLRQMLHFNTIIVIRLLNSSKYPWCIRDKTEHRWLCKDSKQHIKFITAFCPLQLRWIWTSHTSNRHIIWTSHIVSMNAFAYIVLCSVMLKYFDIDIHAGNHIPKPYTYDKLQR